MPWYVIFALGLIVGWFLGAFVVAAIWASDDGTEDPIEFGP